MTIGELMDEIRLEMTDEAKTRWSDAQILKILGKGYRRLSHVLFRNDIELGRSLFRFETEPGREDYPLPADFMADYGLYRDGTRTRLAKQSDDSWEILDAPGESTAWLIRGDNLYIAGTPSAAYSMTLVYWPLMESAVLDTESPTPYAGKFDDVVAEYAALRLKNIDEMDVSLDAQLLQDLENNLLLTYSALSPVTLSRRGWLA